MAPRKPRKPQAIDALASSIAQWISQHSLQNDPYLTGLLAAIEGKKDLHIWAELDPNDYLPHPTTDAGAVDADGVVESDEFIEIAPKAARATKARARMAATIVRGLFMGCTLSFSPYFFLLPRLH